MQVFNNISYEVVGQGKPTIVFVHGFGCDHQDWRFQVDALSKEFRCVVSDNPGFGGSAKAHAPLIPAFATAINQLRVELGLEEVVLVGHSLGTKIVREAYRQHRRGVVGIVLVDGSLNIGDIEQQRERRLATRKGRSWAEDTEKTFRDMFFDGSDPAIVEPIVARAKAVDPEYADDLEMEAALWDSTQGLDQLRQLRVPVLVLQSSHYNMNFGRTSLKKGDRTALMDAAEKEIPQCEVKVIEGVGHFCMLEAPDQVNEEIATFVRRVTQSNS